MQRRKWSVYILICWNGGQARKDAINWEENNRHRENMANLDELGMIDSDKEPK